MALSLNRPPKLTYKVDLPGGQSRLREAVLYICAKCEAAPYFGLTKLNKILWFSDFSSFAERNQPVTGRTYQRLEHGPAPVEMLPLLSDMQKNNEISIESSRILTFDERRPKALVSASMRDFSPSDRAYIDRAIDRFWDLPALSVSDVSHGVGWKSRVNGDLMPYQLSYLSDERLGSAAKARLIKVAKAHKWRSQ